MGFFDLTDERINTNQPPVELLHKRGCALCTLDREARNLASPKMAATGCKTPLIYILGEAPGADEDKQGEQFVGASGSYLRDRIPLKFNDHIRFNNALNCRPPGNRDPTSLEIECCRPRILEDIEATQPEAIFAMGGFALHWAGIPNGITAWRGRRLPVRIGRHVCWLFPMVHPAYLLHLRSQNRNSQPSNFEMVFDFDIRRAFREVAAGLPEPVVHTEQIAKKNIECFTGKFHNELGKIADFLEEAATRERAGVDYETQNLRPYYRDSAILTTAVALPERAIAFAVDHPEAGWTDRDKRHLTELWTRFLCSPVAKTVHHAHFEQEWSAHFYGPEVVRASRWDCTLTQAYILDERRDGLSLEFLCQQHFGINIKQITGTLNKKNMKSEPLAKLLPYNAIDGKYHLHLFDAQAAELQRQKLTAPYEEKLRQIPTCVMTMLKGMPVDGEINKQFTVKYDQLVKEAEGAIMALPEIAEFRQRKGVEFKPGSDKDILFLLREILHKEVPNTDKTVMDALDHPFGKMELVWRNASKMRSTYIEPFSAGRAYPDGLMHPYFGTCFTDTGRLNSSDPNAQNLPKRDEDNREVRRQIAPPNGGIFLAADYGQIEARLIAAGSQDPVYCKATWDGYDVHGYWAGRIAKRYPDVLLPWSNLPEKEQMAKLRDKVKNRFVFPSFFSAQLGSVCHYMGIDENTLKPEYDQFWRDFAGIKSFQDKTLSDFQQQGYVACFNGRRRRAPLGLGQVINAAIQGSAADVVMDGMNRLSEMGRPEIQPMIMIHDDLTFWFHSERELEDNVDIIVHEMLNVRFEWLCVPLTVELSIGTNLCDMQKIGTVASDKLLGWPDRPVFAQ